MKFTIEVVKGVYSLVAEDRRYWLLPENTACVCFDEDGEIWAYESGNVTIPKGHKAWVDQASNGFVIQIGKTSPLDVKGIWRKAINVKPNAQTDADNAEKSMQELIATEPKPVKPVLDGSALRARVTEILDKRIKDGKPSARRARTGLKDLGSAGFTFESYSTMALFTVLLDMGYDFRLHRDYTVIESIESAVVEARSE